ncbi:MAG: LacI family DNA-binding transcriptional regulator [Sedimentisphaeraceae bacterium JB056]
MGVTIAQIAEAVGVHASTVSRALNGSATLSDARCQEIKRVAEQLGYRPNLMAKALQGKRTNTIGIIAPKFTDIYSVALFNEQEALLRELGYMSILTITDFEQQSEIEAIRGLLDRSVDGLLMNYATRNSEVMEYIKEVVDKRNVIFSIVGQESGEGVFDTVNVDICKWSQLLVEHLIEKGHRRIAIIVDAFGSGYDFEKDTKYIGYRRALKENGIEFDEKLVFCSHFVHQDVNELVQRMMSLKDRPTAICAYSDELAGGLLGCLNDASYAVPQDVSLVGFNDDWFSGKYAVPLTTCKLPADRIAKAAVDAIMTRLNDPLAKPQEIMCESELVIRSSVKDINSRGAANE